MGQPPCWELLPGTGSSIPAAARGPCPALPLFHLTKEQGNSGLSLVFSLKLPWSNEGCWKEEFLPLGWDHDVFMDSLAQHEAPVGSPALGSLHSWNLPGIPPAFPELLRELRRSKSPQEMLLLSHCCNGIITIIQFSFSSSNYSMGKLGIREILGEFRAPPGTGAQARSQILRRRPNAVIKES